MVFISASSVTWAGFFIWFPGIFPGQVILFVCTDFELMHIYALDGSCHYVLVHEHMIPLTFKILWHCRWWKSPPFAESWYADGMWSDDDQLSGFMFNYCHFTNQGGWPCVLGQVFSQKLYHQGTMTQALQCLEYALVVLISSQFAQWFIHHMQGCSFYCSFSSQLWCCHYFTSDIRLGWSNFRDM
jgi:hypothetical protein